MQAIRKDYWPTWMHLALFKLLLLHHWRDSTAGIPGLNHCSIGLWTASLSVMTTGRVELLRVDLAGAAASVYSRQNEAAGGRAQSDLTARGPHYHETFLDQVDARSRVGGMGWLSSAF